MNQIYFHLPREGIHCYFPCVSVDLIHLKANSILSMGFVLRPDLTQMVIMMCTVNLVCLGICNVRNFKTI